jgi:hypothetical protein
MFGWFKKKRQPVYSDAAIESFKRHYEIAEGSPSQRGCIAAAMVSLEKEPVQKQRKKLTGDVQVTFMMAYECFVMWAMKRGLDSVMEPPEVETFVASMRQHFAKHGYFQPDAFEKIWDKMQNVMPMALNSTPEGLPYPVTEMLMAPVLAGYDLDPMIGADMEFGIFVAIELGTLGKIALAQVIPNPP